MTRAELLTAARAEIARVASEAAPLEQALPELLGNKIEAALETSASDEISQVEALVHAATAKGLAWAIAPAVQHLLVSARVVPFDEFSLARCEVLLKMVLDAREIGNPAFAAAAQTVRLREESELNERAGIASEAAAPSNASTPRIPSPGRPEIGFTKQSAPRVVGTAMGVVKFFNGHKGFGFIARDDGGEDVFVHISAVEQAGLTGLAEGQPLGFALVDRGGRISATELKIEGEPMPVDERRVGNARRRGPQRQLAGEKATGTVKFFNATKGYGFIQPEDGGKDAFVHISAVERAGMGTLREGDRIQFKLETGKGQREATELSKPQRSRNP